MKIGDGTIVTIHYALRDTTGELLDATTADRPFSYLHGGGNVIPGLEAALLGKTAGNSISTEVAPKNAYGDPRDDLVAQVPRAQFANVRQLQVGLVLQAQTPDGDRPVRIRAFDELTVTIDANHPMAGKTLRFDIEVVEVRCATPEEIKARNGSLK